MTAPAQHQVVIGQPHKVYHLDPAPEPSLSTSIAELLVEKSPRHAWEAHPRLNPDWKPARDPTEEMDDGSALHTLVLGDGAQLLLVPHNDWRTDEAKFLRRRGWDSHQIPVLMPRLEHLKETARTIRAELRAHPGCRELFEVGDAEVTCMWEEDRAWCRLRVDWLPRSRGAPVFDLKFTGTSAAAEDWERKVWEENGLRTAFYRRGIAACREAKPSEYRLIVCETKPPHGINVFAAASDVIAEGEQAAELAIQMWRACRTLRTKWPSYQKKIHYVELPTWRLRQLEDSGGARSLPAVPRKGRATPELIARLQQISAEMGSPLS